MEHLNLRITAVQNYLSSLYTIKRIIDRGTKKIPNNKFNELLKLMEELDEFYPCQTTIETADRILGLKNI